MNDLGATDPTPGAGRQKLVAELFGEGDGQAVEIQLQFPGNGPPLEIVQDPPLHAGFGIGEEFMGLDLCLRQAEAPLILRQMLGLGDREGRRSSTPGFRLVNIKGCRVFNLVKEESAFIRIEEAAHGCSAIHGSCLGVYPWRALDIRSAGSCSCGKALVTHACSTPFPPPRGGHVETGQFQYDALASAKGL